MAKFKKGEGGRPKGAKNKSTEQIRKSFSKLLSNNLEQLETDLQSLEPKERIKYLLDIAKFVVPTLKSTEIEQVGENSINNPFVNITPLEVDIINEQLEKQY